MRATEIRAMRIAVLILGLILGAIMFFQTFLVYSLSGVANDRGAGESGAVGLLMALIWLVACALVIPLPIVSTIAFVLAGLLGFAAADNFPDLQIWGGISLVLAILSLVGWFGKRKQDRKETELAIQMSQVANLQSSQLQQASAIPMVGVMPQSLLSTKSACPTCGTNNAPDAKFCAECGGRLTARIAES